MNELYLFIGSYMSIAILVVLAISMLQRGFFWAWASVKASRGQKTLVHVMGLGEDYFKPGKVDEGFLNFKDRKKENRMITIQNTPRALYRSFGVECIDLDDKTNTVLDHEAMRAVNGYDGKQYDSLYERILMRPLNMQKLLIIIIVLVSLAILVGIVDGYFGFKNYQLLTKLGTVASNTITGSAS